MTNFNYAVFTGKQGEYMVTLSTGLQEWLQGKEDNDDYFFMAWNDVYKAIDEEVTTSWREALENQGEADLMEAFLKRSGHLMNLRDEAQRLAICEDMEGEL